MAANYDADRPGSAIAVGPFSIQIVTFMLRGAEPESRTAGHDPVAAIGLQCDSQVIKVYLSLVGALCVLGCSSNDGAVGYRHKGGISSMELQVFIKTTLLEIMSGIRDAQQTWHEESDGAGAINPALGAVRETNISTISFDVAVTAESGSQGEIGGGIKVWGLNAGGKTNDKQKNATVSRIQFAVPIIPPVKNVQGPSRPLDLRNLGTRA